MMISRKRAANINLDSIGFSASFICAIHCAALPILLTTISSAKLGILTNPLFEISMILISIIVGLSSLLPSYKIHKKMSPIALLFVGFLFIFSGHFLVSENLEPVVTPLGAFTVAFSHLINWKLAKHNDNCCSEIAA